MNILFLTDPSGNQTHVVLPIDEYEALIDARDFDQATNDGGEVFPHELLEKLLGSDSPLKVFRKYRKLTQAQLGSLVGVSKEYISLLESSKRKGDIDKWKSLANALHIDLDYLVN